LAYGHKHVIALPNEKILPEILADIVNEGDFVVCLGAGSISNWAYALPDELQKLLDAKLKATA
jgi:UDP-N-acetylmuramate--alanine ligase